MYFDSLFSQLNNNYRDSYFDTGVIGSMIRYEPQRPVDVGIDDRPQGCLWHECPHCGYRLPDHPKYCIGTNSDDIAVFECDYCGYEVLDENVIHHHEIGTNHPDIDEWIECPCCGSRLIQQDTIIFTSIKFDWNLTNMMNCSYCGENVDDDRAIYHQNYDEF